MTQDSIKSFLISNKEKISSVLISTAFGVLIVGILSTVIGGYILNRIEEKRNKSI